ncbi:hypothetical protein NBRC13296_12255 [Paenibacillus chitinolyticus]|uniref:hypothetical protein n=1 Tax=Paenibacillus chitinolyticus TaxID=79263 RepID=UPI003558509F
MKKCPKCCGKGIIQNYIRIDGGMCYECTGKGAVSDSYVIRSRKKTFCTPKWVAKRDEKLSDEAHELDRKVIQRIKSVLQVDLDTAYDIKASFTEKPSMILAIKEADFLKQVNEHFNKLTQ